MTIPGLPVPFVDPVDPLASDAEVWPVSPPADWATPPDSTGWTIEGSVTVGSVTVGSVTVGSVSVGVVSVGTVSPSGSPTA